MPVSPEPTRVSAWLEGTWMRKTAIPAARNDHADQREVVHRALADDEAEHDGGDHRAGDLGQVEDADVERAVVAGERARP